MCNFSFSENKSKPFPLILPCPKCRRPTFHLRPFSRGTSGLPGKPDPDRERSGFLPDLIFLPTFECKLQERPNRSDASARSRGRVPKLRKKFSRF